MPQYKIGSNLVKKTRTTINHKLFNPKNPAIKSAKNTVSEISPKQLEAARELFYSKAIAENNYNRAHFHLTNLPV